MEKIPQSKAEDLELKEKAISDRLKYFARNVGNNLTLYICILIPSLLIGLIWTDTGLPKFGWSLISDAVLTVVLFVVGEHCMMQIGVQSGKLDDEYVALHKIFKSKLDEITQRGVMMLAPFCDWQIDVELDQAIRTRLKRLKISYEDWESKYKDKGLKELIDLVGDKKAARIHAINSLEPIELTPEILLTDGKVHYTRGGVPISGEEYVEKRRTGIYLLISAMTAVVTVGITMAITQDVTIARLIYTLFKLVTLFWRMANGYRKGATAYNSVEVKHLTSKINYLNTYIEYLDKGIYDQFGDKYGDIDTILGRKKEEKILSTPYTDAV